MSCRKTSEALLWRHEIGIRWHGRFPIDMLRHDNCFPTDNEDADAIEDSIAEPSMAIGRAPRLANVTTYSDSEESPWTVERWKTFGCDLEPVEVRP